MLEYPFGLWAQNQGSHLKVGVDRVERTGEKGERRWEKGKSGWEKGERGLKARHVQVRVFYAKQNSTLRCREY